MVRLLIIGSHESLAPYAMLKYAHRINLKKDREDAFLLGIHMVRRVGMHIIYILEKYSPHAMFYEDVFPFHFITKNYAPIVENQWIFLDFQSSNLIGLPCEETEHNDNSTSPLCPSL